MNLNVSPSPFHEDHDHPHDLHPFRLNYCVVPSSSSDSSCHFFFNSTQDQTEYYHQQSYKPQHHQQEDENYDGYQNGPSSNDLKNKVTETSGLKLTLWKKEVDDHHGPEMVPDDHKDNTNIPVKWMSLKMRVMQKMKNTTPDRVVRNIIRTGNATTKIDPDQDHKLKRSFSSMETHDDLISRNSSSYINNSPVRVCADCNTTKTPLWRSGPQGPKSLCNACGIRQRKARRALAAAAGATNITVAAPIQPPAALKIKVQHKEKKIGKSGHASKLKKRCKMIAAVSTDTGSPSNGQKKLGFEDFLINLSKNLAFHRVLPEDERDAAILLMAISSGMV